MKVTNINRANRDKELIAFISDRIAIAVKEQDEVKLASISHITNQIVKHNPHLEPKLKHLSKALDSKLSKDDKEWFTAIAVWIGIISLPENKLVLSYLKKLIASGFRDYIERIDTRKLIVSNSL